MNVDGLCGRVILRSRYPVKSLGSSKRNYGHTLVNKIWDKLHRLFPEHCRWRRSLRQRGENRQTVNVGARYNRVKFLFSLD